MTLRIGRPARTTSDSALPDRLAPALPRWEAALNRRADALPSVHRMRCDHCRRQSAASVDFGLALDWLLSHVEARPGHHFFTQTLTRPWRAVWREPMGAPQGAAPVDFELDIDAGLGRWQHGACWLCTRVGAVVSSSGLVRAGGRSVPVLACGNCLFRLECLVNAG